LDHELIYAGPIIPQRLIVPSNEPDASIFPSGEKAIDHNKPLDSRAHSPSAAAFPAVIVRLGNGMGIGERVGVNVSVGV
jgi:hypothetical protein